MEIAESMVRRQQSIHEGLAGRALRAHLALHLRGWAAAIPLVRGPIGGIAAWLGDDAGGRATALRRSAPRPRRRPRQP